jgi:hypothetical protein
LDGTKLNMTLKFLAFCISSFQSSWHFAFCILWRTKHPLYVHLQFYSGRTSGFRSQEVGWRDWSVSAGGLAARRRRDQDQFPSSKSWEQGTQPCARREI